MSTPERSLATTIPDRAWDGWPNAFLVLLLLVGLPLLGVHLTGQPLEPYLEFPPQTRAVQPAPFSWPLFVTLALLIVLTLSPLVLRVARSFPTGRGLVRDVRAFPWWGWLGVALTAGTWVLAWNRFSWFSAFQTHTFTPLWVGYILMVNGYTCRRTGRCLITYRPRFFLALFPVSAVFWWSFEYLNRFVQNWYYVGPAIFTPWEYVLHATIPFSTVLPAVLSTMELFGSMPGVSAGLDRLPPRRPLHPQWTGGALLLSACFGLVGIGIWPDQLFPLVWMAPLALVTALQVLTGKETIFSELAEGDATALWLAAIAALVCGLCWEMWNYKSLAHWEYAIPSVHRFKLFEMPLLGYAGYLPFGLECLAVTLFLFPRPTREMIHDTPNR
jgi:hypothetical protein